MSKISHILFCVIGVIVCAIFTRNVVATNWVERPIAARETEFASAYDNANVLISTTGKVTIGAGLTLPGSNYLEGMPVLADFVPGELLFDRHEIDLPAGITSFDLDPDGNVMFVGQQGLYPEEFTQLYFGQDLGASGGLSYDLIDVDPWSRAPSIAIDHHGVPTIAWSVGGSLNFPTISTGYYRQTFDPKTGQWGNSILEVAGSSITRAPSLAFDSQDRLLLGCIINNDVAQLVRLDLTSGDREILFQGDNPERARGTSLAVALDGTIAFAYNHILRDYTIVTILKGDQITTYNLELPESTSTVGYLLPDSLTFDADGLPALVISQASNKQIILARMSSSGVWTSEALPIFGNVASIAFDDDNNPYIAVIKNEGISLLSPNIAPLLRGDFNLDSVADQNDLAAMDQAIHDQAAYMAANPNLINAELLLIGDYNDDGAIDIFDAYTMADNLPVEHLGSLTTRSAGYFALDQAHAGGNFFGTTLATGKTYEDGDARGDLNPMPDQLIDDADIDYLFDQWYLASPDLRCDLNNDGIVGALDAAILVKVILGTHFGDANLDGIVNLADLQILGDNWHSTTASWALADFNGDGIVNLADLQVLGDNWHATAGDFAQLAAMYVPEPAALSVLLTACLLMLPKHRTRC